jgi:phosphatidate phosphatase
MWIAELIFVEIDVEEGGNGLRNKLKKSWREVLHWFKYYGINLVFMLLTMDVTKVFVGEHRPHFLDTCKPDAAINCTIGLVINHAGFIFNLAI